MFTETFQVLKQADGEEYLSRKRCCEWYQHFKTDRSSTEDDPNTGRPSRSTNDDHVEKVNTMIRESRHLPVREVSIKVGAT
jgi:hypothetical protein